MKRFACLLVIGLGAAGLAGCASDNYGGDGVYRSSGYTPDGRYYQQDRYVMDNTTPRQLQRDRAAARDPDCRATWLHQDRPGGSDYQPWRGAPSC